LANRLSKVASQVVQCGILLMKTIHFGIIGCGLMGREFVSAVARWCHLGTFEVRPEIVAICNRSLTPDKVRWFTDNLVTISQVTNDYRQLLANRNVEAVYMAVPHDLQEEFYCQALQAGKHLMGEKPFGIDKKANDTIMACVQRHPDCFVRCSSQFAFYPGMQKVSEMIEANSFGQIIEVNCGFLHCSDLDPSKLINWKRMVQHNGEYGCMGDLGMHACHLPIRAGWLPKNVRAVLSNIITERPHERDTKVPCDTWDNATLLCEAESISSNRTFPLTIRIHRIAPGEKNTLYIEVLGTEASVRFSTKNVNSIEVLQYHGGDEQAWKRVDLGQEMTFGSITGAVFEVGFSDVILQMWAAFLYELEHGKPITKFAGCITPKETAICHRLFTAALESHETGRTVPSRC